MRWRDAMAWPAQALTIVVATCGWWGWNATAQAQEQAVPEQGIEILARGPLHEAFVSPLEDTFQPTTVVAEQPPVPIDEVPPNVRPEDSLWIPGYWFWSATDNSYVWVSGVWRVPPPGQRWIPGYWERTDGGARWISGFWASGQMTQVDYLPPPPESLDRGPTSEAPGADFFWLSGYWVYLNSDYRWQPGYWTQAYDNWMWMPAHYCWTPRGAVFLNGYWDYPLDNRGVAFCPVRFQNQPYLAPGYRYTPTAAVRSRNLLLHMFVGPRWNHFFYGNYYGNVAVQAGLRPWFQDARPHGHPLLSYYTWHFGRQNISYRSRLDNWYDYNQRFEDRRPPVRFADQQRLAAQGNADANFAVLTSPLIDLRGVSHLAPLDRDQQTVFSRFSNDLRSLAQQRASIEVKNEATAAAGARPFLDLPAVDRNLMPLLGQRAGSRTRVLRPDFDDPNLRQPGGLNQGVVDPRDLGRPGLDWPGRVPGDELRGSVDREAFTPGGDPNRNTPDLQRPDINVPGQRQTPRGERPGISVPGRVETPRGIGPGSNVPAIRSPAGERGLDDQNRPDLNQPDLRRPDVNLPGRGQTPQGLGPGVSVPGRVESPRGPGPGGLNTPNIDRPNMGPSRDIPYGPDLNLPDLRRPDVNVPGQGQTPRGRRPGVTVPGRAETPGAYSPSTELDIPEVDSNRAVPGRNDLQPGDRPEVNQPGRMEPPRGYVPGREVPGLPRTNEYRPGISEVPGDRDRVDEGQRGNQGQRPAQTPMPRVDVPRGTDLPTVTPDGRSEMPQLMPRPGATHPHTRGDDRSMFRGTNPGQRPPAVSPEGTTPRIHPGANLNPGGTPGENRGQLNPNPRMPGSDRGGATQLPGGNSLPGGISPNPGGNNPNPGGITPPGSGTPRAGN